MSDLPNLFRKENINAIKSYNFSDLANQTGYITLYAIGDNAGTIFLSPVAIDSDAEYNYTNTTTSGTIEKDIDITWKSPQIVRGDLFVTLAYSVNGGNGVASVNAYTKVRIYHVTSTGTETEIGTQQTTDTVSKTTSTGYSGTRQTCKFSISRKLFAIGEKLRVNVEFITSVGTNCSAQLYHDGSNRNIVNITYLNSTLPSNLISLIPLEVKG